MNMLKWFWLNSTECLKGVSDISMATRLKNDLMFL